MLNSQQCLQHVLPIDGLVCYPVYEYVRNQPGLKPPQKSSMPEMTDATEDGREDGPLRALYTPKESPFKMKLEIPASLAK